MLKDFKIYGIILKNGGDKMEEKLYTVAEIAEYFKVTAQAVHMWIVRGKINAISTPGGEKRITESELKRVLGK